MDEYSEVKKRGKTSRSKDSVFRITLRNQIRLIEIADSKANMVIGINSLILSVIITILTSRFIYSPGLEGTISQDKVYTLPLLIIVIGCLISAVYAIIAAKPKMIRSGGKKREDTEERPSMFFFESFYKIPQKKFLQDFEELLKDNQQIHDHFTIDIYNQGKILHRKFRLISISYTVFMLGFIVGILSFIAVWLFY